MSTLQLCGPEVIPNFRTPLVRPIQLTEKGRWVPNISGVNNFLAAFVQKWKIMVNLTHKQITI